MNLKLWFIATGILMLSCTHEPQAKETDRTKDPILNNQRPETATNNGAIPDHTPQLIVALNKKDEIWISEENCTDKLALRFTEIHDKLGSDVVIHLYIDERSTYGALMKIQGVIEKYYITIRSRESMLQFKLPYSDLSNQQKSTIDTLYPIRIVEHKIKK